MMAALFGGKLGAQPLGPVPVGAAARLQFYKAPEFVLGEPIELTFVLRNGGPLPLKAQTGGDYRATGYPTRYKFEVVDDAGSKAEPTAWYDMGGIIGAPHEVAPLKEYREQLVLQNYVRIDHPGEYLVKVHHDFGWLATTERPYPVAEARIKVVLPSAEEAGRRVQALARKNEHRQSQHLGQYWNSPPFVWMIHPIYLPALEQAAAGGCLQAFEGIHRIRNTDATRALVRLLESDQPEVASAAALFVAKRLPVPNGKERPLRTFHGFITPGGEMELYAHRYWLPELDATVIKAARKMVTRSGPDEVGRAAALLGGLGDVTDAELVIQALNRVVRTSKDRTDPKGETFLAAAPGPALLSALEDIQRRGWKFDFSQDDETPEPGRLWAGLWLMASAKLPERPPVPAAGDSLFAPGLASPYAVVREAALRALPDPAPERLRDAIKAALGDADLGVRRAAIHATLGTRDARFEEPLLKLVRENPESNITRDACDAVIHLGARWQMTKVWVNALAEESRFQEALVFLMEQLAWPEGARLQQTSTIPAAEAGEIHQAWKRFLGDPATESHLRAGRRVPVSDAVMMELGGRYREWQLPDGRTWPQALSR
ncbi:HEAT repeat domain-containing protein [Verrucomicrobium sp. BvORR034]|uniref:HEAT repeat domain-containing protein n=1 Tax=Verrucomicrobium sp. BvORR034 TaxID=1396418 RepID=UPI000679E5C1|nr:HEAT repeat domain-containing protein [Verrucomicrobium sp. BvORR034]